MFDIVIQCSPILLSWPWVPVRVTLLSWAPRGDKHSSLLLKKAQGTKKSFLTMGSDGELAQATVTNV